jgi:hypothetical protein
MRNLAILEQKLKFVLWFFDESTGPFRVCKTKIESCELPFQCGPEDRAETEPPHAELWLEASEAIELQGQLCISLVHRSFREYLDDTVRKSGREAPKNRGNWFGNYKEWFLRLGVDWERSTANLSVIEETAEARNRIQHGSPHDSHSLIKRQDADYSKRFEDAAFKSDFEARLFRGSCNPRLYSLEITKEKLGRAAQEVLTFCGFIEEQLAHPP